jgi:hypothetical protein
VPQAAFGRLTKDDLRSNEAYETAMGKPPCLRPAWIAKEAAGGGGNSVAELGPDFGEFEGKQLEALIIMPRRDSFSIIPEGHSESKTPAFYTLMRYSSLVDERVYGMAPR